MTDGLGNIPYAKELDPDVYGKGPLKLQAQPETLIVIPRVHGICERQLFEVARGEKSNFLEHAGEGPSCESTTRETENTYLIPDAI